MSSYPGTIDNFSDPQGTTLIATDDHALQHRTAGSAIEALERKVGFGASLPTVNTILVGANGSQSSWGTVWNQANLGSPRITGGTINNTLGTAGTLVNPTITLSSDAQGDMYYRNSGGSVSRLGIGTDGQILTTNGTTPSWGAGVSDGWNSYTAVTPTRSSADNPTYVLSFAGVDLTSVLSVGMKIRITQSTVKYFIITAIAFSTNTTVTVYGGTDYDVDDTSSTAITAFAYSTVKAPYGFPLDPIKWTEETVNNSNNTQSSPTSGTWYNTGSINLTVPIGAWRLSYRSYADAFKTGATSIDVLITLSTTSNGETDNKLTTYLAAQGASGTMQFTATPTQEKYITLSSKTTYYLNHKTNVSSMGNIAFRGDLTIIVIRAECAYL